MKYFVTNPGCSTLVYTALANLLLLISFVTPMLKPKAESPGLNLPGFLFSES